MFYLRNFNIFQGTIEAPLARKWTVKRAPWNPLEFRTRSNIIKQRGLQGRPSNHSIKQRVSAFPNRQGAPFGLPKSHSKAFLVPSELPLDVYGRQNELIGRSRTSKLTSYGRFSKKTLKSCSENELSEKKHYNSPVKYEY